MKFQGFVGPSYTLESVNVDCQQCVNMYPELIESGTGKEGQQYYLKSTPGLEELFDIGAGPIRLLHIDSANRVFLYSGDVLYKYTYNGTTWTGTSYGTKFRDADLVKAKSWFTYTDADNYQHITVFVGGSTVYYYYYTVVAGVVSEGVNGFVSHNAENATHIEYIDGYFIYIIGGQNSFYVSAWNSPLDVDPSVFASAEGNPDNIVASIAKDRQLWLFNERSIEVFANVGNADFPFERVSGGYLEIGCVAPYSVAKLDGVIFWLGRSEEGEGIVYAAQGLAPQRISTHAVEQAIQGYADISTATAYTYQIGGHGFYVLNFDEMTWVYDLATKMWHERAFTGDVTLERHRANTHAFFAEYRLHLVGDYETGKVYKLDPSIYDDNGTAITRLRSFPHISAGGKTLLHKSLTLDMETGVGLVSGQGSDPQVILDWSNDGGHTWSDESWTSAGGQAGGIGEYKTRVQWRKLGRARDRVYRVQITDPVKVVMMGADLEVSQGNS